MANKRFVIPLSDPADLLHHTEDAERYVIENELLAAEVAAELPTIEERLEGSLGQIEQFILNNFDFLYSAVKHLGSSALEGKHTNSIIRLIQRTSIRFFKQLDEVIPASADQGRHYGDKRSQSSQEMENPAMSPRSQQYPPLSLSRQERSDLCNALKMIIFLECWLIETMEDQETKGRGGRAGVDLENLQATTGKGGRGRKGGTVKKSSADWDLGRNRCIEALFRLYVQLPIHRLFEGNLVEEQFVLTVTTAIYKVIENHHVLQINQELRDYVFGIVGVAIAKHKQGLNFCLRLIQLLQQNERVADMMAQLVCHIVDTYNQKMLIRDILREIDRIDVRDLSRDSSGPRAIKEFLIKLGEKSPKNMLHFVHLLASYLELDSYMLRNATLHIYGQVLIYIKEKVPDVDLDEEVRKRRDLMLEKLEDHVHDVNSYTRSACLNVWHNLCENRAIPLPRYDTLLEVVIGRLKDRSCFVRKSAVVFLNSFLATNPFNAMLQLSILREALAREKEKLSKMLEMEERRQELQQQKEETTTEIANITAESWKPLEGFICDYWKKGGSEAYFAITSEEYEDNEHGVDVLFHQLRQHLIGKDFSSAFKIVRILLENFDDHPLVNPPASSHKSFVGFLSESEESDFTDSNEEESNSELEMEDDEEDPDTSRSKKKRSKRRGKSLPSPIEACKRIFLAPVLERMGREAQRLKKQSEEMERHIAEIAKQSLFQTQSQGHDDMDPHEDFGSPEAQDSENFENQITKQKILCKYLEDTLKFSTHISNAIPLVADLLFSKNMSDTQEAIRFFVTAKKFQVNDAMIGVKKIITLIWSQEKSIRDEVIRAYTEIYFPDDRELSKKEKAAKLFHEFARFVSEATLGETMSFEQIVKELMDIKIRNDVIEYTWQKYAQKKKDDNLDDARAAAILIGMYGAAKPSIIEQNFQVIIEVGLSNEYAGRSKIDSRLVRDSCIALQKIIPPKYSIEKKEKAFRLPKDHELFVKLTEIVVSTLHDSRDEYWNSMCDEIFKVIFKMGENPDTISKDIIVKMIKCMVEQASGPGGTQMTDCGLDSIGSGSESGQPSQQTSSETSDKMEVESQHSNAGSSTSETQRRKSKDSGFIPLNKELYVPGEVLTRFVTVLGHVALNLYIHLEMNILTELKIRNAIKEEKENRRGKTPGKTSSKKTTSKKGSADMSANLEEEIGLGGANTFEDTEMEWISKVCNDDVVIPSKKPTPLLAKFDDMIVKIAQDPVTYSDERLRAAATMTMAKYMMLSERYCADGNSFRLKLLFTIMEKSREALIRRNTLIALGDLCVRFANLLDPWTPRLFHLLQDNDVEVKRTALKVLSRLIISDTIKVKGHISQMAKLIEDEDENLSVTSKQFFSELSKKQNAIYNVLPDIISNLSDEDFDEENFKRIMKFLFELIEKDREAVGLVEKLCHRFEGTTNERQWRDLAYCLQLINYSDRSLIKLYENLKSYAHQLYCDTVHGHISKIVGDAQQNKQLKAETKEMLEEFSAKIKALRSRGLDETMAEAAEGEEDEEVEGEEPHPGSQTPRRGIDDSVVQDLLEDAPAPRGQRRNSAKTAPKSAQKPKKVLKKPAPRKARGRRKPSSSEEDAEDDEDEDFADKPKARQGGGGGGEGPSSRAARRKRGAVKFEYSSSSEEDESD